MKRKIIKAKTIGFYVDNDLTKDEKAWIRKNYELKSHYNISHIVFVGSEVYYNEDIHSAPERLAKILREANDNGFGFVWFEF